MFEWFKKHINSTKQATNSTKSDGSIFQLTPNEDMIKDEKERLEFFVECFIEKLSKLPEINKEQLNYIQEVSEKNLHCFERIDLKSLFNIGEELPLAEKKKLGLNSRMKICEGYLKLINIDAVNKKNPFEVLIESQIFASNKSHSYNNILKARQLKCTHMELKVFEDTCPKSMKFNII